METQTNFERILIVLVSVGSVWDTVNVKVSPLDA